ncbi:hypothetical protein I546_0132 [Mycobacterium kansasii 732]|nr:hypothetical protein I546_0132 [Mycobacterium kansasii 732]
MVQIVGAAHRLQRRIEAMLQPCRLGGRPGWAAAGVAALGLDTPDGEHRSPADVDHVATHGLPEPMNTTSWCRPASAKAR